MTVIDFTLIKFVAELKDYLIENGFRHFRNPKCVDGYIQVEVLTAEGWVHVSAKIEDLVPNVFSF